MAADNRPRDASDIDEMMRVVRGGRKADRARCEAEVATFDDPPTLPQMLRMYQHAIGDCDDARTAELTEQMRARLLAMVAR